MIARYLRAAIKVDGQRDTGVSGCAVISTATAAALTDPEIRQVLDGVPEEMDAQLLNRLKNAKSSDELPGDADIESLGFLLFSTAHSICIRVRAGQTRQDMEKRVEALARTFADRLVSSASTRVANLKPMLRGAEALQQVCSKK